MALDGTWETTTKTPMGPQKGKIVFAGATGYSEGPTGKSDFQDFKAEGDAFSFWFETKTPMGMVKVSMEGKVEGDVLTSTAKTPFGPANVNGKRVG